MEKQITAVEWLLNELDYETISKFDKQLLRAKQKEEDQIMNAWVSGVVSEDDMTARQYYNETYKK
jgi:hypothetical protein